MTNSQPLRYSFRKSILTSTTFWSVILLLCQAIGPSVERVIARGGRVTLEDTWAIFQACVTALVGVVARYNVGDIYTPKGVPGVDPPRRGSRDTQVTPSDVYDVRVSERMRLPDGSERR